MKTKKESRYFLNNCKWRIKVHFSDQNILTNQEVIAVFSKSNIDNTILCKIGKILL